MSDFLPAYESMIIDEGGYKLHTVQGDKGGATYAGIARNHHPGWPGWEWIDRGAEPPAQLVRDFYRLKFWDPLRCGEIRQQAIAASLFNFAVNAGIKTSAKLAQAVVGVTPDGQLGPKSLEALNAMHPERFAAAFALAKLARYAQICNRDRSQSKFLLGWVNRTLRGLA